MLTFAAAVVGVAATVGCGDASVGEMPSPILTAPPRATMTPRAAVVEVGDTSAVGVFPVADAEGREGATPSSGPQPLPPVPTAMVAAQERSSVVEPPSPNAPVGGSNPSVPATQLSDAEIRALLSATGWDGALLEEAVRVFCGYGNARFPNGESRCIPSASGDRGNSLGLAQLNGATWAPYCGVTQAALFDAETNLWCARKVYQYDIDRGHAPWAQWSVKP
jgi:hypothetical protein